MAHTELPRRFAAVVQHDGGGEGIASGGVDEEFEVKAGVEVGHCFVVEGPAGVGKTE